MILLDRLLRPTFVELMFESGWRWDGGLRSAEKEIVRWRVIWGVMKGWFRKNRGRVGGRVSSLSSDGLRDRYQ